VLPPPAYQPASACALARSAFAGDHVVSVGSFESKIHRDLILEAASHLNVRSYLFDPYVLHESVIDASKILTRGIGEVFNAYPKENAYNFLKVTPLNATKLLLEKHRFNTKTQEYGITQFHLDTRLLQDQRIPIKTPLIAYHPEQTTLSIRILDKNSGQLTHVIYPVEKLFQKRSSKCIDQDIT
jgi:hypothetical protein